MIKFGCVVFMQTCEIESISLDPVNHKISKLKLEYNGIYGTPLLVKKLLKTCVRYFLTNFCFSPNQIRNDRPAKTMKDVFYFI